jgi:lipopolysaccharide transport system permease protein
VENRPSRGWRSVDIGELWGSRELIWFVAWRDVKSRYKQAALGVVWAVVQPLAGTAALILVFRRLAGVPSDGIPYAVFALAGYAVWTYVSATVGAVTHSVLANSALVTKVYFPRLVAPLSAVLPGLLDLAISLVLLGVMMVVTGTAPPAAVVLLPACVLFAALVSLAVGLWLATANVLYRDVGHAVGFLVQLWFFATPVAYPATLLGARWRLLYAINPAVGTINAFRAAVLGGPLRADQLAVSLAAALLLLAGGLFCFQRLERRFADVI